MLDTEIEKAILDYPKVRNAARKARRLAKKWAAMGVTDPVAYKKKVRAEQMREWRARNPERSEELRKNSAAKEKVKAQTDPAYRERRAAQQKAYQKRKAMKKAQELQ